MSARPPAKLPAAEALALLGSVPLGRVIFTSSALPAIRPVSHIMDKGHVIIRTGDAADIVDIPQRRRTRVVAYQADQIDLAAGTGWTVTTIGATGLVSDPEQADRYRQVVPLLAAGQPDYLIQISCDIIAGFRLTADRKASSPQ